MRLLFSLVGFFCLTLLQAQPIAGTKTICTSGCDYPTLTAAASALNLNGVGAGGAVLEISNGHTETLPGAGISLGSATLNASLSAFNPLVIRKNPSAPTKPVFTSGAGTGGMDAMVKLLGVDYLTLENLVFVESSANISSITQYEYGIMLVKRNSVSPVDGCQNNTIRDCEITFRRSASMTPTGIYAGNHLSTNTSTISYTLTSDAHSFNTITGNAITNAQLGIYFAGISSTTASTTLYDQGNTIGTLSSGNMITRFGANTASVASGIIAYYQNNLLISGNSISGGGNTFSATINGIDLQRVVRGIVRANTISDTASSGTNNGVLINNTNTRLFIDSNFIVNGSVLTGTFNGINAVAVDTLVISANRIGGNRYLGTASGLFTGILLTGVQNKYASVIRNEIYGNYSNTGFAGINLYGSQSVGRVFNNRIYNDTCVNGQHVAILNNQNSNQSDSVSGNEVFNLVNLVNGSVYGYLKPVTGTANTGLKIIEGNSFYNLRTKMGTVKAIEYNNSNAQINIAGNKIYGFRSDSINATLTGIETGSGAINVNIFNNLIYDFETYYSPFDAYIQGIYINNAATNSVSRVFHNTIYFNAQNSGNLVSYCMRAGIYSDVEARNNIFINKSLATLNGFNAAYYREGSNLATYRIGSNNNLFYAAGTPGRVALYFDAATKDSTLAQLKSRVAPRESESYLENVVFQQASFTPYNLTPASGIPSQIESGANRIDTPIVVNRDINGALRSARYPDLGCYEGNYLPLDLSKPSVTCTTVRGVSPYQAAPQISVVATDRFGVKTAVSNRPRLYFKKKTDANTFIANSNSNGGWKFVTTTDAASPFNFQVNYALLQSAIIPGDTIEFFATAEDSNANIGAGSVNLAGTPTSTTLVPSNFPVTGQISIIPVFDTLSGTFTVGTGGNFTSLTAALKRFEASVQTGPVTFLLTNSIYATPAFGGLETFPLSLSPSIGMSTTNTLLIKPAAGMSTVIFGTVDSALFVVRDGVNGFTFDGSNNSGDNRHLSLYNTHVNGQSVIFLQSNNTNGGVRNVVLKNLNLKGNSLATNQIIIIGARTGIGPQAIVKASGADRITVRNCNLYYGLSGFMAVGSAASPITNLLLENNRFSTDSFNLVLAGTGIYLEGVNNAQVQKNTIMNMFTQFVTIVSGIYLGDNVANTTIRSNLIHNIESANNNSTGCFGIFVSSGIGVNNDSIYNNSISRILSSNSGNPSGIMFNTFGIKIDGGTSIKVFYNSVHLSGGSNFGSGPNGSAAILINGGGPFTGLEIRNNIFSNRMLNNLSGSRQAAIWTNVTLPITGATINHNNYYVNGFGGVLLFDGISNYTNLTDLRTVLGGNANSIAADPLFVSTSNLRPLKGGVMRIGPVIPNINVDIVDSVRSNTLTRIGCYENEYDVTAPYFGLHQNAINSGATPLRTLSPLVITDTLSGVNLANGRRPRVYFKKKSEGNGFGPNLSSFNGWKYAETSSNASPYTFNINYALLTSLPVVGDSIYYFFVAADSVGNYGALPAAGFASASWDSLITPPTFPYRYRVIAAPMAGVYRVGSGGNYTTLTAAVTDINQRGITAPVTLLLTQATYTTPSETFPIAFSSLIQGVSATNTISIRPANGVTATITGSGFPALVQFNGCTNVIVNGSDTLTNADRKIIMRNTTGDPCVIFENDASYNQIRNCKLYSENYSNSNGIVKFGTRLVTGNDFNLIDSCQIGAFSAISRPYVCISAFATTGPSAVLSTNNLISNNELFSPNNFGILVDNNHSSFTITGNSFYKNYTYTHAADFYFIGYYADGGLIANNFFGGSAARCGGTQPTVFDGTTGTFSLLNVQGTNVTVRQNTFKRIQWNGLFNNLNHSLIGVLNGKVIVQENILGGDTGTASIQINYTNSVGSAGFSAINIGSGQGAALDSVQVLDNRVGAVLGTGGGLLNLYGLRFNASSGNFIARGNLIGSNQTAGSIRQSCNGDLLGIEYTVNNGQQVVMENNTIRNLEYTLPSSKTLTGIFFSGNSPAMIRSNTIQQLTHVPTNPSSINTGFNFLNGIYVSASGTGNVYVSRNKVTQIQTNSNPSGVAMGIQVSGSGVDITGNTVAGIGPLLNVDTRAVGISTYGSYINLYNNEVALGADSLLNSNTGNMAYYGISKNGDHHKVFHNTVRIMGSNVSNTGTNLSIAYYSLVGDATDSVFNNIFMNQRSNTTAAGGKHYATYFYFGTNPVMNRNLLFANGNNGFIGNAANTDYTTLPAFAAATSTNAQSRSKLVNFEAPWRQRLTGASIGDTSLSGIPISAVRTDIDLQQRDLFKPYMGCDESVSNPLPVELVSFTAQPQEQDVWLQWKTSQETNNKGFYLERSQDGISFEPIAFYAGAGNASNIRVYQHTDTEVLQPGKSIYYRLLQEDHDGNKMHLGTRMISSERMNEVAVYPNPANERLWLKCDASATLSRLTIYNSFGKELWSTEEATLLNQIKAEGVSMQHLPEGIYFIEIMMDEVLHVFKVMH